MIPEISNLLIVGQAATEGGEQARSMVSMMGPLILMVVIFYFILIRPQQKQQKQLKVMLEALKVGDRVLTSGGILGIVSQVKEKIVVVKIAENTKVEMLRSGIQQVLTDDSLKDDKKETK
jgi:preprotein translocase subunit YajC